jgi:hypothetical protein
MIERHHTEARRPHPPADDTITLENLDVETGAPKSARA